MAKSMGAEEYVVKPFELEDLTKVVRRLTKETEGAEEQRIGEKRQSRNR
jgi:DNA-binding response OmpR family regulator